MEHKHNHLVHVHRLYVRTWGTDKRKTSDANMNEYFTEAGCADRSCQSPCDMHQ